MKMMMIGAGLLCFAIGATNVAAQVTTKEQAATIAQIKADIANLKSAAKAAPAQAVAQPVYVCMATCYAVAPFLTHTEPVQGTGATKSEALLNLQKACTEMIAPDQKHTGLQSGLATSFGAKGAVEFDVNKACQPSGLERDQIVDQVLKTNGGPSYHEWLAAEFVGRVAALVPRSPLRAATTAATRGQARSWRPVAG